MGHQIPPFVLRSLSNHSIDVSPLRALLSAAVVLTAGMRPAHGSFWLTVIAVIFLSASLEIEEAEMHVGGFGLFRRMGLHYKVIGLIHLRYVGRGLAETVVLGYFVHRLLTAYHLPIGVDGVVDLAIPQGRYYPRLLPLH